MKKLIAVGLVLIFQLNAGMVRIPGPGGSPSGTPPDVTSLITSISGSSPRNNYTGYLGGSFIMASTVTATQLGRYCLAGNSQSHDVYLMDLTGATTYAHVTVTCSGSAGFVYQTISQSLTNGSFYTCLSGETNGGDTWNDDNSTITTTAVAALSQSVYTNNGPPSTPPSGFNNNNAGHMYVPCNIEYHL